MTSLSSLAGKQPTTIHDFCCLEKTLLFPIRRNKEKLFAPQMSDLEHLKLSPTYYIGLLKIFGHCDLIFGNGSCLDLLPIIMDRQEQRTRKLK